MTLILTGEPRVVFRRHQIELALCQLRVPRILRVHEPGFVAPFQEAIGTDYPALTEQQQFGLVVGPDGVNQIPASKVWRFDDRDRRWSVVLASDFIALEARRFTRIEEFSSRLRAVLEAFGETLAPTLRGRLGLRFVNHLRHDDANSPSEWARFLRPSLLGPLADELASDKISQAFQELRMPLDATSALVLKHGYMATASAVPVDLLGREPTTTGPFYLLDIDCAEELEADFAVDAICDRLHDFNEAIREVFMWATLPEFQNYLEPESPE